MPDRPSHGRFHPGETLPIKLGKCDRVEYPIDVPPSGVERSQHLVPIKFLTGNSSVDLALPASYNLELVAVSVLIASIASYAVFGLSGRMKGSEKTSTRAAWLVVGAATMGMGVWAMHFIGMLALRLPIPVTYDIRQRCFR